MANTFKNGYLDITSSNQTIYTAPASTTTVVIALRITNKNGSSADTVTAEVVDSSSGQSLIASTLSVPADSSLEIAQPSKIVLETGDYIQVLGGQASGYLEAFISVLEIT